jgi:hypothetical protein
VRRRADTRAAVDVDSDVSLVRQRRFARVDAHSNPHRRLGQRRLRRRGREHGVACASEGAEERIALRVHLDTAVESDCVTNPTPVLNKRVRVSSTEFIEQARRSFDIGEQERDRAAGETHAAMIARGSAAVQS